MRFPRFHRFEYVLDLLISVDLGRNDLTAIDKILKNRKQEFEHIKYVATGRGKQNSNVNLTSPSELTRDCVYSCLKMGLILADSKKKGFELTDEGRNLLNKTGSSKEYNDDFNQACLECYLKTYSDSLLILKKIRSSRNMDLDIPDTRNKGHITADELNNLLGVRIDALSLKNLIYTLGQNQLLNFRLVKGDDKNSIIRTYLTCEIYERNFNGISNVSSDYNLIMSVNMFDVTYSFKINDIEQDRFENVVWQEYLKITKNHEDIPIYYWDLRSAVCYSLRISDSKFDHHLLELNKYSKKLRMGWSSGYVPSNVSSANAMKSLPPKIDDKYHVVYLRLR